MNKLILSSIFLIECLVIVFLTFRIFNKKLVLGEAVVAPIKKESVVLNKKSKYKYYYEPKANTVKQINADWGPYNGKYTINDDTLVERYNYGVFAIIRSPISIYLFNSI